MGRGYRGRRVRFVRAVPISGRRAARHTRIWGRFGAAAPGEPPPPPDEMPALVAWGPDFGGLDGDQFQVEASLVYDLLELIANLQVQHDPAITELVLVYDPILMAGLIGLDELALVGNLAAGGSLDFDNLAFEGNLAAQHSLAFEDLATTGNLTASANIDLEDIALVGNLFVGQDFTQLEHLTGQMLALKDVYVPIVVGCADNTNHDAQDLRVDPTVATRKDSYIGFQLNMFPAGATVTAATLRLQPTATALVARNVETFSITDGNEGWSETGLTCSPAPPAADGANKQTFTVPANDSTEVVVALNSTWRTRLQNRMGAGICTFLLRGATAAAEVIFQDTESGAALGPRLEITYTVPV